MRFVLAAALVLSSVSFAQTSPGAQQRKAPTSTIIFGEGELVDGDLKSPDVDMVTGGHKTRFDSMIRVRDNFADKLKSSVTDLR